MTRGAAPAPWTRRAEAVLRPLCMGLAALATLAGAAIVALLGASVLMRHVAGAPFRFTEELVGLFVTAAFFLALPLVTLNGDHVRVRLLVAALPPRGARWARLAAGLFGIVFCVWFVWLCLPWFEFAFDRRIKTEVARLLMYPWMALMPLSLGLAALALAVRAFDPDDAGAAE
ncbi:MAG: TRAP transporter small permease [Pseudomonadota bacterium]